MCLPPTYQEVQSLTTLGPMGTPGTTQATTLAIATLLSPALATATTCAARTPGVRAGCTRAVGPCAGPSVTSSPPAWVATGTTRDRTDRTASSADRTEDTTDTIQASTSGRAREVTEGDG